MRWPWSKKDRASSSENVATAERQAQTAIRSALDIKDPKSGRSLVEAIVMRSGHAIKDGDIQKDYNSIQLDPHGGDIIDGTYPALTPRLTFNRKDHRISPVTLKFSRLMDDKDSLALAEQIWSGVRPESKKALMIKTTEDTLKTKKAEVESEQKRNFEGDEDRFYFYRDQFHILLLTVCINALKSGQFEFEYGIDGNIEYSLKGQALEYADEIRGAYFDSTNDEEDEGDGVKLAKEPIEKVLSDLKKKLRL